jgi:transcription-repair coupling factor (superfamily II helicase)
MISVSRGLFGNEVESIRVFDPLSQLSQKKISQVTIVPNIQTQFSSDDRISLLDFISDETVLWFSDVAFTRERIKSCFEHANDLFGQVKNLKSGDEDFFLKDAPGEFFSDEKMVMASIEKFSTIEFGRQFFFPAADWHSFDIEPQPSVNKNFNLLIDYWRKYKDDQISILLFSDNPNQFRRLDAIFDDLKADVIYQPVTFAIKDGFIDRERKVACYTDHQVFERYHRYHLKEGYQRVSRSR